MDIKWKIFIITFFSYSTIHSVRTMWSAAKSNLTAPPFNYQVKLLGTIDMIVLFTLAISMNIFGRKTQVWGPKKCLFRSLLGVAILNTLIGIFLVANITSQWLYITFFGVGVGVMSSFAWPSCLYMVGLYFNKKSGFKLSIWNGSSQFGDFISLSTYYLIAKSHKLYPQISFFIISIFLFTMAIVCFYIIPNQLQPVQQQTSSQQNNKQKKQSTEQQMKYQNLQDQKQQKIDQQIKSQSSQTQTVENKKSIQSDIIDERPTINFLKVWLIPGVMLNVFSFGLIKAVNSFMIGWMVYYLLQLNLGSQAFVITISWSCSVFIGGIICGIVNSSYNKLIFIGQLCFCMICFVLFIVICGFFYGGPYSLMGTAIPLSLGNKPQVEKYSNGKTAIIALTQGFGQLCCGLSLIIIPSIGIRYLHVAGAVYCFLSASLLLVDFYMANKQKILKNKQTQQKQTQKIKNKQIQIKKQQQINNQIKINEQFYKNKQQNKQH